MARLTRAQQQERTRAAVLAAAEREFGEHGYVEARIDRIAERAELTRGAVYSNFPGKRALYLAVLVDMVERSTLGEAASQPLVQQAPVQQPPVQQAPVQVSPSSVGEALGAFARVWLERLPLVGDTSGDGHLRLRSLAGALDDEPARTALAQVTRLEALLLALALESYDHPQHAGQTGHASDTGDAGQARRVRLAELVLTLLTGWVRLAETAPGFGDPFDVARACEQLAAAELSDAWDPPHLPYAAPAQPSQDTWEPPSDLPDLLTGRPADLGGDGVIALLGAGRLAAAEEAVRAAPPDDQVSVVVLTSDPAEIGRLVRLRISDLTGCLRRVFAPDRLPRVQLVPDDRELIASAAGLTDVADATEAAVRIRAGKVVARANGRGAVHAAASSDSAAGSDSTTGSSGATAGLDSAATSGSVGTSGSPGTSDTAGSRRVRT